MYLAGVATPEDPAPEDVLQLIGDPVRWQILRALARGDRRVNELTALAARPQSLVSYHLRELRDAGLVVARRSSADGRDSYYRIDLARCRRLLSASASALHPGIGLGPPAPATAAAPIGRPRVLFLCTGNSARSQIAQALLEVRSGHTVEARSAGSHPKVLHPNAIRVLAERGIDISHRQTTHVRRYIRSHFDHVITLCDKVREVCPDLPHDPELAHWSLADPALAGDSDEATYPAFERTAEELEARIGFLLAELTTTPNQEDDADG